MVVHTPSKLDALLQGPLLDGLMPCRLFGLLPSTRTIKAPTELFLVIFFIQPNNLSVLLTTLWPLWDGDHPPGTGIEVQAEVLTTR